MGLRYVGKDTLRRVANRKVPRRDDKELFRSLRFVWNFVFGAPRKNQAMGPVDLCEGHLKWPLFIVRIRTAAGMRSVNYCLAPVAPPLSPAFATASLQLAGWGKFAVDANPKVPAALPLAFECGTETRIDPE